MAKMRATARMPRGLINRYRTRMMTADDTFDAPSKWSKFYLLQGWATMVPDEPAPEPKRRGRPPKHTVEAPEEVVAEPEEPPLEEKTRADLIKMAEERGVELPDGYVTKDELVNLVSAPDDDDDGA